MTAPVWVRDDVVTAVHRRQIAEHGGDDGIRDPGLLEAALARPLNLLAYAEPAPTIPHHASAYAYGIVRNHPFVDSNKRTGFVISLLFLRLNQYRLTASREDKFRTFYGLAAGSVDEDALGRWFETNCEHLPL